MNKILIIEDDPAVLFGLEELFKSENYTVVTVTNGKEGLNLALSSKPDLILLDINLPDLSGFDVCRKLRESKFINPIIMLTARTEQVDKVVGLEIGADDYITKPFDSREVIARVRAHLRRSLKDSIPKSSIMPDDNYTRKLLSIMFSDMKDYSKKMNLNESLAIELLQTHNAIMNKIIRKYRGRVIEIIGDAYLTSFENALDAVYCARDIQLKLKNYNNSEISEKQIEVRIGIHVGDVIEFENNLKGDTVNIAKRIQDIASPGSVDISASVYKIIKNKVSFPIDKKGKHKLKNIKGPVTIYRIDV
ncbi:MAG: response regulator [Ignavibacteria bacterium]|nr:response regulator [Ignavibacteria bacterium]